MNSIGLVEGLLPTFLTVLKSLAPILGLFVVFQLAYLRLPWSRVFALLKGVGLALVGITIFLHGVHVGFSPVASEMGEVIGKMQPRWVLVPFGFVMGFLATLGEPAVRVLGDQVEDASGAAIRKRVVLLTVSLGVALFVALGMARILYDIELLHIVIPGYLVALGLVWLNDRTTVSIAFDAGGVATGPMAVTFLLSMAIGITSAMEGRDVVADGFGLIALIALAPILSIMGLGLVVRMKYARAGGQEMESGRRLIVTVVRHGWGDKVLEGSMKAGAEGGTVMCGRGLGVREHQKILGIIIEPEREVVLSVVRAEQVDTVLEGIRKAGKLDEPGTGLAFVVPVEKVAGVVHLERSQ